MLVVGQEYRPPFYGHVFMFELRDHLIRPFTTGYEGTAIESLYPSNTDMFRKAKAQGATVGYVHAFGGQSADRSAATTRSTRISAAPRASSSTPRSGRPTPSNGRPPARPGFYPWYAVLNNGLRVTAVGGEDSISSMHDRKLVGSARTYVYTGDRGLDARRLVRGGARAGARSSPPGRSSS